MKIIAEYTIGPAAIRLVQGDITLRDTEAIVNAANSHLQHGGGVAGAIVRRGGHIIQEESDKIGFTPVGTSVITGSGSLQARYVIHAVGPRMGEGDEDNKLKSAVQNSLILAAQKGIRSLAFPAISSGIFGFPKDRCAAILIKEAADFLSRNKGAVPSLVEFCIYDDLTLGYFKKEFEKLGNRAIPVVI